MPRIPTNIIVALATLATTSAAFAQEAPKPAPAALSAVQTEIDAGEVVEGDAPRFVFTLTNSSEKPLKLKVVSFCGCTVPRFDPEIAPGGKGTLEATMNTKSMKGKTVKVIAVRGEDPTMGQINLYVRATVRPLVKVEPATAAFVQVKDRGPDKFEFTLTPEPGKGIQFTKVASSSPYFLARLAPTTPGGPTKVVVSITPDAPPGHLQTNLAVMTNSTTVPRVGLLITGEKGIAVSPRTVYWGGISETSVAAREEVMLTKRSGRFAVRSVIASDPAVKTAVETVTDGSQYRVVVTYAGGRKAGRQQSTVKIATDDPAQPEIIVQVQALVNPATAGAAAAVDTGF